MDSDDRRPNTDDLRARRFTVAILPVKARLLDSAKDIEQIASPVYNLNMIKYFAALCGVIAGMNFALAGGPQEQTIYKWTDVDGVVHYDSTPPPAKIAATKLRVPLAKPAATANSGGNINRELQKTVAARIERERAQRQEADERAAQLKLRAEQDAALQAECNRAGRSYCDDLEKIHANEIRHAQERQRLRQHAVRDAANLKD